VSCPRLPARVSFELGQDGGNVREVTERHRALRRESSQQPLGGRGVGLWFLLQQQQRDFHGGREGDAGQLSGQDPNGQDVASGEGSL
jgi:hypothetical protein